MTIRSILWICTISVPYLVLFNCVQRHLILLSWYCFLLVYFQVVFADFLIFNFTVSLCFKFSLSVYHISLCNPSDYLLLPFHLFFSKGCIFLGSWWDFLYHKIVFTEYCLDCTYIVYCKPHLSVCPSDSSASFSVVFLLRWSMTLCISHGQSSL